VWSYSFTSLHIGPTKKHCRRGETTCSQCAKDGHISRLCTITPPRCINCGGEHNAMSNQDQIHSMIIRVSEKAVELNLLKYVVPCLIQNRQSKIRGIVCSPPSYVVVALGRGAFLFHLEYLMGTII